MRSSKTKWPKAEFLMLSHGTFKRDRSDGHKSRVYYRCQHVPESGPHAGHQCEFRVRNDSPIFGPQVAGAHGHCWSLLSYRDARPVSAPQRQIVTEYLTWVCKSNLSIRQSTHRHTFALLDSVISYGYSMAQSQEGPSEFPRLTFAAARKRILEIDTVNLDNDIQGFQSGYVHLSIDAGTVHINSIVDFVLLRTAPEYTDYQFLLYSSTDNTEGDANFYRFKTCDVIQDLHSRNVVIRSIVGDGLAPQLSALCHNRENSIQNKHEVTFASPYIRNIYFIYCSCHLLNLAFEDALRDSRFLASCTGYVRGVATALHAKKRRRALGARCPTFSETRWCHIYILVKFLAKHYNAITNISSPIALPPQLFGFGVLIEPLFLLFGKFESRSTLFYMREEKLAAFRARMRHLKAKFGRINYMAEAADLICAAVGTRFAEQNDDMAQLADFLGMAGDHTKVETEAEEWVSPMETFYEEVLSDEAVAAMMIADLKEEEEEGEEAVEEEEDHAEEESSEVSEDSIVYEPGESQRAIGIYEERLNEIRTEQARKGLVQIGVDLIDDYGLRSEWAPEKIDECKRQLVVWFSVGVSELARRKLSFKEGRLIWTTLGASSEWGLLAEYAQLLLSFPIAETENERFFSVRRYVTGDRGGRTLNDLVTARVRIRARR